MSEEHKCIDKKIIKTSEKITTSENDNIKLEQIMLLEEVIANNKIKLSQIEILQNSKKNFIELIEKVDFENLKFNLDEIHIIKINTDIIKQSFIKNDKIKPKLDSIQKK